MASTMNGDRNDDEVLIGTSAGSIPAEVVLVSGGKEIRIRCETDQQFAYLMGMISGWADKEEQRIQQELGVSPTAAAAIAYLRTRSRWSQDKEDVLVSLDKSGSGLPDVYSGEL